MAVKECINKIPDNVLPKEQRDEYISKIDTLVKDGVDERMAGIHVIKEFHKQLHDDLNTLKKEVGVKQDKYVPFDNSKSIKSIEDEYGKLIEDKNKELSFSDIPFTVKDKNEWSNLSLEEKRKLATENLPEITDGKTEQEIVELANNNSRYLLAKLHGEEISRPVELKIKQDAEEESKTEKPIQQTMEGSRSGNEPITTETGSDTETIIPETTRTTGTEQSLSEKPSEVNALKGSYDRLAEQMEEEGIDIKSDPQMQAMKQKINALQLEKTIPLKGKELADKIRSLRIQKNNKAYATIFALPIAVYDTAIVTIANAIEGGALLADAINEGIRYIKTKVSDWEDDGNFFAQHIIDFAVGEKPKLKVQVEAEGNEEVKPEPTDEETQKQKSKDVKKEIDNYAMTTSGEVELFMSNATWEDIWGEIPEGDQAYITQKLVAMLQDGKSMIAIAQEKWGNDIMDYGRKLFSFIQDMGKRDINETTNKQAVLLATFLGEIKESIEREPNRRSEIEKLEKIVFNYYKHFMNVQGKILVAGRLLRLYRDKYLGDVFANRILEEQQIKWKSDIQNAENDITIDDKIAEEINKPVTQEEKIKEDKQAKERKEKSDKKQSEKKSMSTKEAQQKASDKLKEMEDRLNEKPKEGEKSYKDLGTVAKIKDSINKLNCK